MSYTYRIETVSRAFSGPIPEQLWGVVGHARTERGAYQIATRERRWYHPDLHAWTGHVRIVREHDGAHVQIKRLVDRDGVRYDVSLAGWRGELR